MTPAGCVATDSCDGTSDCHWCSSGSGPGEGGCYCDSALGGDCPWYWSSSSHESNTSYAWDVTFSHGNVTLDDKTNDGHARCVRGGP